MADKLPLVILPAPKDKARGKHSGGPDKTHVPARSAQARRLGPRFDDLRRAFEAHRAVLRTDATGVEPEDVIVLETVGSVADFVAATRKIPGLEWLGEIEEEDLPPDDDFFSRDSKGNRQPDKTLRGRMYLVFANHSALNQILSLWNRWKQGTGMAGFAVWKELFKHLRDVRRWSAQDRLRDSTALRDWAERCALGGVQEVPCEIELWYRSTAEQRIAADRRVSKIVDDLRGHVRARTTLDEIAYHAILADLPITEVTSLIGNRDVELLQCEQVQFVGASGQMAVDLDVPELVPDNPPAASSALPATERPIVALLDGLPLQNHHRLAGRLVVDDPDSVETIYSARDRVHGTAMASLILHGELDAEEAALGHRLYVRPILRPDPEDPRTPRHERVAAGELVVDVIHRAVRRMFEGEGGAPPVAPDVKVINLSVCIADRPFDGALSPLARLLDWLAIRYGVLFVVSAGNHAHDIAVDVPATDDGTGDHSRLQDCVLRAVAGDNRHRRVLSPAESLNALTVAASHEDRSAATVPADWLDPFVSAGLPTVINGQGMGYRRAIKPEVLQAGGRVLVRPVSASGDSHRFEIFRGQIAPGQRVASPGMGAGDLGASTYTRGTSNAAALTTRNAVRVHDTLVELLREPAGVRLGEIPEALWLKVLLIHGASWGATYQALRNALLTDDNGRRFREYLTRLVGYGVYDVSRVLQCTSSRVTVLSCGALAAERGHIHALPLPPCLSGQRGRRRLTITLAWFSPAAMSRRSWRAADLWFAPPGSEGVANQLQVERGEADWRAVQRGTAQHEVLEGEKAVAFVDGEAIQVAVSCRSDGELADSVPYALAATLEVAPELGLPIYQQVRERVRAAIAVAATP